MNINKLLKNYPRLLERIERLERSAGIRLEVDTIKAIAASIEPRDEFVTVYPTTFPGTNAVDNTPTATTLAPIVSERSQATTGDSIGNETGKGNRRRPSRRN